LYLADEVLRQGVQGITDLITMPGVINVDFADVKTVMLDRGVAHMGVGRGNGESRVNDAVSAAVDSPLLETTIKGARAILLNIAGGYDLSMLEVNEAAGRIQQEADRDAIVILGTTINEELQNEIVVTVIATGFDEREREAEDADADTVAFDPDEGADSDEAALRPDDGEAQDAARQRGRGLRDDDIPDFLRSHQ
ncbi:MAG: cell division protein FtsZ, partial [Clostridiales Family XIII bacterium]|nr:cell division protein FtsZ [Clostridiales Family XIII bacterium]